MVQVVDTQTSLPTIQWLTALLRKQLGEDSSGASGQLTADPVRVSKGSVSRVQRVGDQIKKAPLEGQVVQSARRPKPG